MDPSTGKPLPRDDDPIERAFLSLDAKLAIWAESAAQLGANLATAAAELAKKSNGSEQIQSQATAETVEPCQAVQDVDNATELEAQVDEPVVEPVAPAPVVEEGPQEVAHTDEPEASSVEGDAPESDDDLLASLEPELANKIRVMRRLNPDRDIREMIEQYKSQQTAETTEQSKKQSWWKRKR